MIFLLVSLFFYIFSFNRLAPIVIDLWIVVPPETGSAGGCWFHCGDIWNLHQFIPTILTIETGFMKHFIFLIFSFNKWLVDYCEVAFLAGVFSEIASLFFDSLQKLIHRISPIFQNLNQWFWAIWYNISCQNLWYFGLTYFYSYQKSAKADFQSTNSQGSHFLKCLISFLLEMWSQTPRYRPKLASRPVGSFDICKFGRSFL